MIGNQDGMEQAKTKKRKKKKVKKSERRDLDTFEPFFPFSVNTNKYTSKLGKNQLYLHESSEFSAAVLEGFSWRK